MHLPAVAGPKPVTIPTVQVPMAADAAAPEIPDKAYFRIGEVSRLVGVDTHVLRYWESEFTVIRPFRGRSKQRLYRRQDVDNLLRVKQLLHDKGYTIAGARKALGGVRTGKAAAELSSSPDQASGGARARRSGQEMIGDIRDELAALQRLLARKSEI